MNIQNLDPNIPVLDDIAYSDLVEDPYPIYARLRKDAPIAFIPALNRIMITRAQDTKEIRRQIEYFGSHEEKAPMLRAMEGRTIMRKDGEEHKQERNSLSKSFSPPAIMKTWVPIYEKIADQVLEEIDSEQTLDLFQPLAARVSSLILAQVLGLNEVTAEELIEWSQTLIDGAGNFVDDPDIWAKTDACNKIVNEHIDEAVAYHRKNENFSVISTILHANTNADLLTIRRNVKVIIGGGLNEPRDAILTLLDGLLSNPDQLQAVKNDTSLHGDAFEEAVRWVAPISNNGRIVYQDRELSGITFKKGQSLLTSLASANHDETLFEKPEKFNIFREKKPHQAFGGGAHFCMGTFLTRKTVANHLLPKILERYPKIAPDKNYPTIYKGFAFRGPLNLNVKLHG